MTRPNLTIPARLREILLYNPETGQWTLLDDNCARLGTLGGYQVIYIGDTMYKAGRLAWLWMRGEWPSGEIDHINLDRADNRWCNLREATRPQNVANRGLRPDNTSGFKGVSEVTARRWKTTFCGKSLGYFATPELAAAAYSRAAVDRYGEFAKVSIPWKTLLTDRALKAIPPAAKGTRKMIWDASVPSFGVRVSEHGKLTFIVMRRLNGKLIRRTLGQYPILALADARKSALEALRDIAQG